MMNTDQHILDAPLLALIALECLTSWRLNYNSVSPLQAHAVVARDLISRTLNLLHVA